MSKTEVPKPGPLLDKIDLEDLLETIQDNLEYVMGDMDKAGDMTDHVYYEGLYDAYYDIRSMITKPLAEKTCTIVRDTHPFTPITGVIMNEQTATDLAETIVPETATVATTIQSIPPFAIGVVAGGALVVAGYVVVTRRKNRKVVVTDATI